MTKDKQSVDFGVMENLLSYAYQICKMSRYVKTGALSKSIRECQPNRLSEWQDWFFLKDYSETKRKVKIDPDDLVELGQRLHSEIFENLIPELQEALDILTEDDCITYIYNIVINKTYDAYEDEKYMACDKLAKLIPEISFDEEYQGWYRYAENADFLAKINDKLIGIKIKPIVANANLDDYSLPKPMKKRFDKFTEKYGGKVFLVLCYKGEIVNTEVVDDIKEEVKRLSK